MIINNNFDAIFREMDTRTDRPATLVQRSKVAAEGEGGKLRHEEKEEDERRRGKRTKESARAGFRRRNCHAQWQQQVDAQFPAFPRFPREICPRIPYDTRKLCHLSKSSGENFGKLGRFFHNNVACNGISSNE